MFPSSVNKIFQKFFLTNRSPLTYESLLHCSAVMMCPSNDLGKVKDDSVLQYQQDGVVCLRGLFSEYWLDKVRKGIQKNLHQPSEYSDKITSKDGKGVYFNDYMQWRNFEEFAEYVKDSPAASTAGTLLGLKDVTFYHEHVFVKESFSESETPWHHDQSYYPINGWQNCSIWMPVNPVRAKSGLKFIKGSHRWGKWFAPRYFETFENYNIVNQSKEEVYETMPEIDEHNGDYEILSWDMEPGDCLAFHMRTVHGTYASTPSSTRQTIVTRWLGDDATLAKRPWQTSPPVLPDDITFGDPVKNSKHFTVISNILSK